MRDTGENKVRFIFIRHGKTKGNLEGRYIGRTDEVLCEEGIDALSCKDYPQAELIFSSPMLRCTQTASILYPSSSPSIIEEFRETDFGDFEGKNYNELNGNEDYQRWIDSGGTIAFPNGESREEFIERTMRGFEKLCASLKGKSVSSVAVVAHGGTIMAILSSVLGGDYFDYQIKNGEVYECSITL